MDISFFIDDDKKFNTRVAVMPIKDGKMLIQKIQQADYYSLVGGRVQFGETSLEAIVREIKEELAIDVAPERLKLQYIGENFFQSSSRNFHEYLFVYTFDYFECPDFQPSVIADKTEVQTLWWDIDKLKTINLKPAFIKNFYVGKPFAHVVVNGKKKNLGRKENEQR